MPDKRWLLGSAILISWSGFGWLQYRIADTRIEECHSLIRAYIQRDICVRDAIEARDFVWTWAIGVPVGLLIASLALIWIIKQVRR